MRLTEQEYEEFIRKQGGKPTQTEPAPKKPKYNNNRVKVDGFLFDSQVEADYYGGLKIRLRAGVILGYCRQPEFILTTGIVECGVEPMVYRADFIVFNLDGTAEIVDTKGSKETLTDVYIAKKKVFLDKYPMLTIKEVYKSEV